MHVRSHGKKLITVWLQQFYLLVCETEYTGYMYLFIMFVVAVTTNTP